MQIGTKLLKNRLSYYLRQVRAGEVVHVTDRGKVIAELRGTPEKVLDDAICMLALEADGLLTVGTGRAKDFAPIRPKSRLRASRFVIEERR